VHPGRLEKEEGGGAEFSGHTQLAEKGGMKGRGEGRSRCTVCAPAQAVHTGEAPRCFPKSVRSQTPRTSTLNHRNGFFRLSLLLFLAVFDPTS